MRLLYWRPLTISSGSAGSTRAPAATHRRQCFLTHARLVLKIREPAEVTIDENARAKLPTGLLAEAALGSGNCLLAYSTDDGRIVLSRAEGAVADLLGDGDL